MSLSAHKMYGPKGIGALYVRRKPRVELAAQMDGGGHERGLRSGTLNVPAIVGFGEACAIAAREMAAESARLAALRDRLQAKLLALPGAAVNGSCVHRLPNNLNVSFPGVDSESLLMALPDVAISSGSACSSATLAPSHVLRAIGLPEDATPRRRPLRPRPLHYRGRGRLRRRAGHPGGHAAARTVPIAQVDLPLVMLYL